MGDNDKGKLYKKTTTAELWANPKQTMMIQKIENLILCLIEYTKSIKKHFSIAHDKNTSNIK